MHVHSTHLHGPHRILQFLVAFYKESLLFLMHLFHALQIRVTLLLQFLHCLQFLSSSFVGSLQPAIADLMGKNNKM